jgi:hypothetical protein
VAKSNPIGLIIALTIVYAAIATLGSKNGFDVSADGKAILGLIGTVVLYHLKSGV